MRNSLVFGIAAISLTAMSITVHAQPAGSADELNAQSAPAPTTTTEVYSSDPAQPDAVITDMPGNMASVPPAGDKAYPVCTARLQDNCQNRGEGGAPGRSRALKQWPGKPASEM